MTAAPGAGSGVGVRIGLSAVVMALKAGTLCVLTTRSDGGEAALPFGPFDPGRDRTFELALRRFVTDQTGFRLGFVEQLYTFGDAGRDQPRAAPGPDRAREVSVGYLALTAEAGATGAESWSALFEHFPWEDRRTAPGLDARTTDALTAWADGRPDRLSRVEALFALAPGQRWNEERVLERYELLYEAGLVAEAIRDGRAGAAVAGGRAMASDHRRILATALGRLRSKLKYRPVLFDLTPPAFTLSQLQAAAEAVAGLTLHKQNFRRGVERTGMVQPTGALSAATGGRPAELFRFTAADPLTGAVSGLTLPGQR